ncbi:M28 family peptidase [Flavobacteriaceae bacterium AH-315-B10]|nr:M28 family peptidase [Flavobacteriaceae bacterium AH-315-B10]
MPCKGQTVLEKQSNNQELFDAELLLQHVKVLSSNDFEGRQTGTQGATKAKQYIINEFRKLNIQPLSETYEQSFSFSSRNKMYNGVNVLGFIKGSTFPDEYIVISAHYDHEGIKNGNIYNGADDNASGISALFSFAEYFKNYPPKHSVILAAFDGEEFGLKGSKYFVDHSIIPLNKILVNLNLDMISRSDKNELFVVGTRYNPSFKELISSINQLEKIKLCIGHDGTDNKQDWTYSSDHASFYRKEIPFLFFSVEDHKDYHKPTDDYENIHPEFYKEAVNVIFSVFKKIDVL